MPLGILFLIIGALLAVYGASCNPLTHHGQRPALNIDLWWGLTMVAFGLVNVVIALVARRSPST
jgi:TRAP-type C4-dicarboxylate transport system permease small subunit